MPIEVGVWRLGEHLEKVSFSSLDLESRLEDILAADLSILSPGLMLIGRQWITPYGKRIDLMAIDVDGNLSIIELKRDRTPRDIVAQVLDYAESIQRLGRDELVQIYSDFSKGKVFDEEFAREFGDSPPEQLNESHRLYIVATELDTGTERIIDYLANNYGVPINALFFRYFCDKGNEYLVRSWLIDPREAEAKSTKSQTQRGGEPWNGRDYYVAIGEDDSRNWDDCLRYGFVSGGGGRKYSRSLYAVSVGSRVFAYIPKVGYVGVGVVQDEPVPVREFRVQVQGSEIPILAAPLKTPNLGHDADDTDMCEHLLRVKWLASVSRENAFREKGMFANQNTACKLRSQFTLERLTRLFNLAD